MTYYIKIVNLVLFIFLIINLLFISPAIISTIGGLNYIFLILIVTYYLHDSISSVIIDNEKKSNFLIFSEVIFFSFIFFCLCTINISSLNEVYYSYNDSAALNNNSFISEFFNILNSWIYIFYILFLVPLFWVVYNIFGYIYDFFIDYFPDNFEFLYWFFTLFSIYFIFFLLGLFNVDYFFQ